MSVVKRSLVLLVCAAVVTAGACDCGGDTLDNVDGGGTIGLDAGNGGRDAGPVTDGGDLVDGGGTPPPTNEQLAVELCLAYTRGLLNLERHLALEVPPARCSNEDDAPDVSEDEPLPVGTCGVQDPLRDLFFRALTGGRVSIDIAAFRACVSRGRAIRTATPTLGDLSARATQLQALPSDAVCAAAITPLVTEEGATCLQAWDCALPLACQADPLDSFSLKCLSPAAEGERCDDAPPFDDVMALRTCAEDLACVLGVCTSRLAADAACTDDGVPCGQGLTCRSSGTCGAPANETEGCADTGDCAQDLYCDGATLTCVPYAPPAEDGESCDTNADCASLCSVCRPVEGSDGGTACQDRAPLGATCSNNGHCQGGLFCDGVTGTCALYRDLDEACGVGAPCVPGLVCTDQPPPPPPASDGGVIDAEEPPSDDGGVTGPFCQPRRALGESCQRFGPWRCEEGACVNDVCYAGDFDDPCVNDNDCNEASLCVANVCTRAPRSGAPCTVDGRCDEGLVCTDDRCRELPAAGEPCAPGRRCAEDAFCPDGVDVCEALRPPGQACTKDGECQTNVCLDTLTCGAEGASCLTSASAFAQLVGLSLVLPLLSLRRRRRARSQRR